MSSTSLPSRDSLPIKPSVYRCECQVTEVWSPCRKDSLRVCCSYCHKPLLFDEVGTKAAKIALEIVGYPRREENSLSSTLLNFEAKNGQISLKEVEMELIYEVVRYTLNHNEESTEVAE